MKRLLLIVSIMFCVCLPGVKAQSDTSAVTRDSISALNNAASDSAALSKKNKKKIYSTARRAAILSAVLPGLGQGYNKKYWKIPIIYAGLAGFGYMFATNATQYNFYRKNLIAKYDSDSSTVNTTRYTGPQLQELKKSYKKSRDFGAIGFAIIYLVNIVDANVDGHLKTFDVSDDLSLTVDPWQYNTYTSLGYRTAMGLSVKLTFK